MADHKEEDASEFKVVDRRAFTSDGQRRTGAESEKPEPEKPEPQPSATSKEAPPTQAKPATAPPSAGSGTSAGASPVAGAPSQAPPLPGHPQGPVQFEHLVMSLVTTAMLQLGMAARPGEAPSPPDLPAAQETIDLLGLLQQKTKGNLTKEEEELLTGSLQELRLVFVELTRRVAGRIR